MRKMGTVATYKIFKKEEGSKEEGSGDTYTLRCNVYTLVD